MGFETGAAALSFDNAAATAVGFGGGFAIDVWPAATRESLGSTHARGGLAGAAVGGTTLGDTTMGDNALGDTTALGDLTLCFGRLLTSVRFCTWTVQTSAKRTSSKQARKDRFSHACKLPCT